MLRTLWYAESAIVNVTAENLFTVIPCKNKYNVILFTVLSCQKNNSTVQ